MKLAKFISAAAALIFTAANLTLFSAFADPREIEGDQLSDGLLIYERVDEGYKVIGCESNTVFDSIPSIRNGYAVVEIADEAFAGNTSITSLSIPSSIKTIGDYAFASCSNMKSVTIAGNLEEIGDGVFAGCSSIEKITIPDSVKSIGTIAFQGCTSLKEINIPEGVTSIGDAAFEYCHSLTELTFPASLTEFGSQVLLECPLETIKAEKNNAVVVEDNVLYNKSKTILYRAAVKGLPSNFIVPESVAEIEDGAFFDCEEIETVSLPSSVRKIGQEAFMYCLRLNNIDLNEGLMEIDISAFAQCIALKKLAFPTTLASIGEGAFYSCVNLESISIPNSNLETIGGGAFAVCDAMKEVTVPECVKTIGEYALGFTIDGEESSELSPLDGFKLNAMSGSAAADYAKDSKLELNSMGRTMGSVIFIIVCAVIILAGIIAAVLLMRRGKKLAPADVRKAEALEKAENDPSYEKIIDKSDKSNEQDSQE